MTLSVSPVNRFAAVPVELMVTVCRWVWISVLPLSSRFSEFDRRRLPLISVPPARFRMKCWISTSSSGLLKTTKPGTVVPSVMLTVCVTSSTVPSPL